MCKIATLKISYTKFYLSGDGGDKIGMALRFASDKSSVQFATPEILNVTLSLNIVSFLVGVEIALRSEARCPRDFAPFNYNLNLKKEIFACCLLFGPYVIINLGKN